MLLARLNHIIHHQFLFFFEYLTLFYDIVVVEYLLSLRRTIVDWDTFRWWRAIQGRGRFRLVIRRVTLWQTDTCRL